MPSFLDVNDPFLIDLRADIIVPLCDQGEGGKHIQRRHRFCRLLDPLHLCCDRVPHLTVQVIFQGIETVLCSQDHVLQFFELRRDVSLRVCKGLFPGIVIRHHVFVRIGDLQIIAENFIIFDTKILDPGLLSLVILQFCKPVFAVGFCPAQPVYFFIVSVPDDISFLHRQRRLILYRLLYQFAQVREGVHVLVDVLQKFRLHLFQDIPDRRQHLKRTFKCDQVAGIGGTICDLCDQTLQVIDRGEIFPYLLP